MKCSRAKKIRNSRLYIACQPWNSGVFDLKIVLCIDRDDDIGRKTGIKTPVIGRQNNIDVAVKLASADPEESDVNTIFGGIKVYDNLKSKGEDVEIVSVSGDINVGLTSDRKIANQLDNLLDEINTSGVIVVTDGVEDESLIPIIQSRAKIDAINRIVVRQSQNLENTYYVVRQMLDDPKVSRTFLIPIGLVFIAIAVSLVWGRIFAGSIAALVGIYMIFRAFGLGNMFTDFTDTMRQSFYGGRITYITYVAAILLVAVGIVIGLDASWQAHINPITPGVLNLIMKFINASVWWYVGASLLSVAGRIINYYIEEERIWKHWAFPFFTFASGLVLWGGSEFVLSIGDQGLPDSLLYLVFSIAGAIVISLIGVWVSAYTKNNVGLKSL